MEVPRKSRTAGNKQVSPDVTHTPAVAGQSLTTFASHLLCRRGHHYSSQKFSPLQCCPGSRVVCYSLSSVSKLTSLLIHWGDRISPLAGYTFINSLLPIGICPALCSPIFFFPNQAQFGVGGGAGSLNPLDPQPLQSSCLALDAFVG